MVGDFFGVRCPAALGVRQCGRPLEAVPLYHATALLSNSNFVVLFLLHRCVAEVIWDEWVNWASLSHVTDPLGIAGMHAPRHSSSPG